MAHSAVSGVSSKPDWLPEVANWTGRETWDGLKGKREGRAVVLLLAFGLQVKLAGDEERAETLAVAEQDKDARQIGRAHV